MSTRTPYTEAPTSVEVKRHSEEFRQIKSLLTGSMQLQLKGESGDQIVLPNELREPLLEIVHLLASGKSFSIISDVNEMTSQEAADYLNVSRPYLVSLLEKGEIPFHKTGSHRRVILEDLQEYKTARDHDRRESLERLTEESRELGLYGI